MNNMKNMKKTKHAIFSEGKHYYDITVHQTDKTTSYEMRYSNGDHWTSHTIGKLILSAIDHGNGIRFTEKIKKSQDYDDFIDLKVFIDFIYKYDSNIGLDFQTYTEIN